MRGFCSTGEISRRSVKLVALSLLFVGITLLNSGCAGIVSGKPADGGSGSPTPLSISNVGATNVGVTAATVAWQTSAAASSQVEYGPSSSYGASTPMDPSMVVSHQQSISSLKPATLYHYRVHSTDSTNASVVSGDMTLTTANDTTPPTVAIVSPAPSATLSGTVSITANASDAMGVASVQFKVDSASVGAPVTTAPYVYALNTTPLSNGNHILTAVATDTLGNVATSAAVAVKVNNSTPDTTPPTVSMTSPANGATVSGTVVVSANAADNVAVASVQFQLDGANVGAADTVAPYAYSWDTTKVGNGVHTLRATATDTSNNSAVSATVSVTVNNTVPDTTPPTVAITSPANGASVSSTVVVSANASDNVAVASVQFQLDGANVGAAISAAPYAFSWDTTKASNGSHTLRAIAKDTSNNTASSSVTVTVNNTPPDTTPPVVTVTSPANGASVSGTITLSATATDPDSAVSFVQFLVDGAAFGAQITAAPYSVSLDTTKLANGSHVVSATGKDPAGNQGTSAVITITVNNASPVPNISGLNPASGLVGATVTVSGANFGATQGASSIAFNGTTAAVTSWSATSIAATVPAGATTGNVVVTVGGQSSNGVTFTVTVPAPSISSLNPTSGLAGSSVTISGANFGATQGASNVKFNGTTASVTNWSANGITATVPNGATTGAVVVTVGGQSSNGVAFAVTTPAPTITSLNPTAGLVGATVAISGANFGATQGASTVAFNGTAAAVSSWSASSITATVPAGATTGNVVVTVSGQASNGVAFTVSTPAPSISSLNPTSGLIGSSVTISGASFGATQGVSTVKFNGTTASVTSWSATSITATVPAGATTGNVVVTVGGQASNGVIFTVTAAAPSISGLNPASGLAGASVTISGANFGGTQGTSSVAFNGTAAGVTSWSATSITATVPTGATTGNVVVTVGGQASNGATFTVTAPAPSIASVNPASGLIGATVTISGANFGATQGASTVTFGGTAAAITSWSASSITATVPSGAVTGNVVVTVGSQASNGVAFTVTAPAPSITSLNPTSGLIGATVTISGPNFGATQGASTVKFNGTTASVSSWSATSITATVPAGATTGSVVVTVGGQASNGVAFTVTAPAPSITSLNPTSGLIGATVTISGANFGATQGVSTVKFNGTTALVTSWSATSITAVAPVGATTGNVVVTVGGQASNGVTFTVTLDTTAPVVAITAPTNGASVSGTITLSATATDPDSPVSFVQFLVDGVNTGSQLTSAPYSISLDTTTLSNANHTITAVAQDPTGNKGTSAAVSITVSNGGSTSMGPLKQSTVNSRYFVDPSGNGVFLSGSHTWNDFQDTDTSGSTPAAVDFNAYVNMLKQRGHNVTILWHKDLPEYCGWNFSGSVWKMDPWPWLRPGPGVATDGGAKFDLSQFNQAYFDRLFARAQQLQQNGIYAIIELFDGNQLTSARCSTDGYPYTGANNVNGVDDGYSSGSSGTSSYTMTSNNAITDFQDAYVKKVIDTLNGLPNVIFEVAEEEPPGAMNWWAPHIMGLVRAYEGGGSFEGNTYTAKPFQHPVGIGSLNYFGRNDGTLYSSVATWIAPSLNTSGFPENVSTNNQGKVVINDSDHTLGYTSFTNSNGSIQDQNLRGYIWENITNGAGGLVFMDPYIIFWQGSPVRNTCANPVHQVCNGVDTKLDSFRASMGFAQAFVNANLDLVKATPQGSLSSTGFCLADNAATGAEYLAYAPNGGTFSVNLSATTRVLNVQWLNPANGAVTNAGSISGGSTKSFTAPFSGDAVLYIRDAAGHN